MASSSGNENPQVRRGADADLSQLRDAVQNKVSIENSLTDENEEVLWEGEGKATWSISTVEDGSSDTMAPGQVLVTTKRLMFVATAKTDHDGTVDAECILMHAMSKDPVSVYVQITDTPASGDDDVDPTELTLVPTQSDAQQACQSLFDALSQLVSLHPIQLDDDDQEDDDDDDGMMFVAPPTLAQNGGGVATTGGGRETMLDRLDNMLVVPPEYEIQDGQFDDADEDDEDDAML